MSQILCRCLLLFAVCLLLTGCWDRKELNQLAITSATAVDWDGKVWTVSYQVVIPQSITNTGGNSGQQAPVMVFSTSGGSIRGAVQKSSLEMPRSLFFAHTRVLIIGEKAAEHGISQLLDVYLRNPDSRETVNVLVSGGEGRKILEQIIPLEKVPGAALQNMIRNEDNNGSNYKQVMLYQVMLGTSGDSPYTLVPEIIISGEGDNNTIASLKNTSFPNKLKLGRTAIFKKDKLVGWFTKEVQLGNNWINNQIDRTTLYFRCTKESEDNRMAIRIDRAKTKLKPIILDNGRIIIRAKVTAKGNIVENACPNDPTQPKDLKALEQAAGAEISKIMLNAFHASVEKKVDIFHLADTFHKHDPNIWRQVKPNWEDHFAKLQLDPQVHVKIARLGMSGKAYEQTMKMNEE